MNPTALLRIVLPLAVATTSLSAQAVLYRETFSSTVNNANHSNVSWAVQRSNGTSYTNSDLSNYAGLSSQVGRLTDVGNVNAGSTTNATVNPSGQTSTGFLFTSVSGVYTGTGLSNTSTLVWTNEYAPVSVGDVGEISFYLGNSTNQNVRIAVQVGTQWYVTSTTFNNTNTVSSAANFASTTQGVNSSELKTFSFNTAASNWNTVTFQQNAVNPLTSTGAGSLSLGALATNELSGNINAFGLYIDSGNTGIVRFDTFTLTAIPEPSTYAALVGAGVLGLSLLRRRRR